MIGIPQDIPLKDLLLSVGVEVKSNDGPGVSIFDVKTGEKINKKPQASYELGQEVYLQRKGLYCD